ncbi:serine hydrolase domain-containing protein [Brevibacillus panacihumi]|uniref:serine hydrolase domain-containing protein n=1 Tax=Brevibacillus panacihumi TaxID=497735 RepID=UPI003D243099
MRKFLILVIMLVLLIPCLPAKTIAVEKQKGPALTKERLQSVDRYLDEAIAALGAPGGSVALVYQGEQVYARSWGVTGGEKETVTSETPFLIGSISKSVTAYGIMRLIDEGILQADEPVQKYLPWFTLEDPEEASRITIRQLLSQTSGFGNQAGMNIADRGARDQLAIQRNARELAGEKSEADPGAKHIYSNANYALLGAVIEDVSGMTYADYMESHIFTPLGMEHTAATVQKAEALGWQPGYRSWLGLSIPSDNPYDNGGAPYGYLAASSSDMARFLIALQQPGTVVSAQRTKEMMQPEIQVRPGSSYGFGWRITQTNAGETRVWHAGSTPDFRAELVLLPDSGWGIVMLTNQNNRLEEDRLSIVVRGLEDLLLTGETKPISFPVVWERWLAIGFILVLMGYTSWIIAALWRGQMTKCGKWTWGMTGCLFFLLAGLLIPGLLYAAKVSWHTFSLFAPDLKELTMLAVILLTINGLFSLIRASTVPVRITMKKS